MMRFREKLFLSRPYRIFRIQ